MGAAEKIELPKMTYDFILNKLEELPTLPAIVGEINNLVNDPMSTTKEILDVMEKDQSLTTKVLKLVNSGYYAIPGGVKSLERAITLLGFEQVRTLVISTSVFNNLKVNPPDGFDIKKFWQHSIGVAMTAETIAKHVQHKAPHELFTGGLVHDMGKIALLKISPEIPKQLAVFARANNMAYVDAEDQFDTVKHAMVGHMLAQKWKLPVNLQGAIRYHHHVDIDTRMALSVEMNQFLDIIIFANMFIHFINFGDSGHSLRTRSPEDLNTRLHVSGDNVKEISLKVQKALDNANSFMEIIGGAD